MANTYVAIASSVISTATGSVTFSSIPQTYTDLILRWSARDSDTGQTNLFIRFNGDSSTNYSDNWMYASNGGSATFNYNNSVSQLQNININSSSNGTNFFGFGELKIPNYTLTTTRAQLAQSHQIDTGSTNFVQMTAFQYRGTSAISSMVLTPGAGNFQPYSRFDLYGITHA